MQPDSLVREDRRLEAERNSFCHPRMEGPNLGDVRTVFALRGSISRNESLVESAAVPAVPASPKGLQVHRPGSKATSTSTREDCAAGNPPSPQSAPSDRRRWSSSLVKARTFVVQWRRIVPARRSNARHAGQGPQFPHFPTPSGEPLGIQRSSAPCTIRLSKFGTMVHTPLSSPRPAGGPLDCLEESVRPEESESRRYHTSPHGSFATDAVRRTVGKREAPFGASEPTARRRAESLNQAVTNSALGASIARDEVERRRPASGRASDRDRNGPTRSVGPADPPLPAGMARPASLRSSSCSHCGPTLRASRCSSYHFVAPRSLSFVASGCSSSPTLRPPDSIRKAPSRVALSRR